MVRASKLARRLKREMRKNGDRQFYKQVVEIKRNKRNIWKVENKPERLKAEAKGQALRAIKRAERVEALRRTDVSEVGG